MSGLWTGLAGRIVLMLGFAFASSWWSYQQFYSHLGIAPQDIGLTPSGGLSDIIGGIVRLGLWLALALIVLGLLPVLAVSATAYASETGAGGRRRAFARLISLGAGGFAVVVYWWLTGWVFALAATLVGALSFLVWRHFAFAQGQHRKRTLHTFVAARKKWALAVLDVFSVVAVVGLLLVDLPDDAARAAQCVVGQGRLAVKGIGAPVSFIHLTLLDVYAQPATISWISSSPPPNVERTFDAVYLGTSGGWVVAYRKTTPPQLVRFPAGSVIVRIDPSAMTCREAH
jgi:hypothetical protein